MTTETLILHRVGLISKISDDKNEKFTFIMILLFAGLFTWLCFFGQKIPINNGIGWDGIEYVHIVKVFPHYLHAFDQYRSHRVFPSFVVALGLRMLGLAYTDSNIIHGFEVLNYVSVLFSVVLWWCFVTKLNVNLAWRLISFAGLFLNVPILTITGYNPVITDTVAFACGIAVFYFYFAKKPLLVFLFGLLGCFTFPTFSVFTFFLLLFPYQDTSDINMQHAVESRKNPVFNALVVVFSGVMALLAAAFVSILIAPTSFLWPLIIYHAPSSMVLMLNEFSEYMAKIVPNFVPSLKFLADATYLSYPLLALSTFAMFSYLYFGLKPFNCFLKQTIKRLYGYISLFSIGASLLLMVINLLILSLLSNDKTGALTPLLLFRGIFAEVLSFPLMNIICSFIYYGPFVFFLILFWKRICINVLNSNVGCALSLVLLIPLSLTSESRKCIGFIGMLVFLVLLIVPDTKLRDLPKAFSFVFVGLSLVFSKCWFHITLPMNNAAWGKELLSNSWQGYFMNFGIWMSPSSYILQLGFILLSLGIIHFFLREAKSERVSLFDLPSEAGNAS